uniref:Uncharacterized protein n=1 Tax=Panagrolaimus davidi TaxID=227884 RepID=A0A914QM75_9BILA
MNHCNPFIPGRIPWPEGLPRKQNFSIPENIIYYAAMNPSTPKVYNKMIQCCKYFFEINSILVGKFEESKLCSNDESECLDNFEQCCVEIDISKITSKLWLINKLCDDDETHIPNFTGLICSKLYQCDINLLALEHQNVLFDNFKILVSSVKTIVFEDLTITDSNGSVVMLESIFEALPNVKNFIYTFGHDFTMVTHATIKNMMKLEYFESLHIFGLSELPEIFEVKDLFDLIMNYKDTKIVLEFCDEISDEYKDQLDVLIDIVIESEIPNVIIEYDGQVEEKLEILEDRYFDSDSDDETEEEEDID